MLVAVQVRDLALAANQEFITVEIVRAGAGAVGVLAAVPLSTALAVVLAGPSRGRAPTAAG